MAILIGLPELCVVILRRVSRVSAILRSIGLLLMMQVWSGGSGRLAWFFLGLGLT